jgi:hypothetical protein
MKKLFAVVLAVVLLATLGTSVALAAKPGTDFSGPHYNLNIVGKKADWNGGGSYDNPSRHTMFVPQETAPYAINLNKPNKVYQDEDTYTDNVDYMLRSIRIWMTQGEEFAVLDGSAFNDPDPIPGDPWLYGECAFQLGPGKYNVYIVAKAKPGSTTNIDGWVYAEDETGFAYYLNVGSVSVTKKASSDWDDATGLFYVSDREDPFELVGSTDMWVFDYMTALEASAEIDPAIVDTAYFWQFDNQGNKLIKVRFYPI